MRLFLGLFLCIVCCGQNLQAAENRAELGFSSSFTQSVDPLTTEKTWVLDRKELNPHRQRWVLERDVRLEGLAPVALNGGYGVRAKGVSSVNRLYVRGPGPWFHELREFGCEKEANDVFATVDGTVEAGKVAAKEWEVELDDARTKLGLLLGRVKGATEQEALLNAKKQYVLWYSEREAKWFEIKKRARAAEWRTYLKAANKEGFCKVKGKQAVVRSWQTMLEQPLFAGFTPKLLARAPARLWNGLFVIRVSFDFSGTTLVGQFLLDSGAATSMMSPGWLESQGILPSQLALTGVPPVRVAWSGGMGVARRAAPVKSSISGYPIELGDFLLMETELFAPPENRSSCCDGVLGVDFLRSYVVDVAPGPPAEVRIWARDGFVRPEGTPWMEASVFPESGISSSCQAVSADKKIINGLRWDTGGEFTARAHDPWLQTAKAGERSWSVQCDQTTLAKGVSWDFSETGDQPFFSSKAPGFSLGMDVLGRGLVTYDLPHGRIWLDQAGLSRAILKNRTGLELGYRLNRKQERELVVVSIAKTGPAAKLSKQGLKPGVVIVQLDGIAADEFDEWQVNQRLAGAELDTVTMRWQTKDGFKIAPLKVR